MRFRLQPRIHSRGGLDSRREMARILGRLEIKSSRHIVRTLICLAVASATAFIPVYVGLSPEGVRALFILVLAAGLWVSEAIPAFAVGILVIALEVVLLGRPADSGGEWKNYVIVWGHPLIWLFFGGLVLAAGAAKTGLDRWLASKVLPLFGTKPPAIMLGVMLITFIFSMFMSNTATTAMMLMVLGPLMAHIDQNDPYSRGLLLSLCVAANVGGMATIIGTPPNAIAAGMLDAVPGQQLDFGRWMLIGLPPAIVLAFVGWLFLVWRYPSRTGHVDLSRLDAPPAIFGRSSGDVAPLWQRLAVMVVFIATVVLWITSKVHGIPTAVISFLPITSFTVLAILTVPDIRELDWDVLLLLAGGLALGVAVRDTGLAVWIMDQVPLSGLSLFGVALAMAYLCLILSNFMSNTAAANILVPIGLAMAVGFEANIVVPIALGASAAMALPISTPPNAIAFTSGRLEVRDFLGIGLVIGLLAPILVVLWTSLVLERVLK